MRIASASRAAGVCFFEGEEEDLPPLLPRFISLIIESVSP
jgi:hypothetical protein